MSTSRRPPGRGLVNLGNTCYLNSVVQSLNALPLFHDYLKALKAQGHNHPLLNKLQITIEELAVPFAPAFRPLLVADQSVQKHFKPGDQQDAHEFLTFLLDEISSPGSGGTPVTEAKQAGLSLIFQAPRVSATLLRSAPHEDISLTASVAYPRFATIPTSSLNSDGSASASMTPFPLMEASLRNSMASSSYAAPTPTQTPTKMTGFGPSSMVHSPLANGSSNGSTRNGPGISPMRSTPTLDRVPSPNGLSSSVGPSSSKLGMAPGAVSSPPSSLSSSKRGNPTLKNGPAPNGASMISPKGDGSVANSMFHSPAFLGVSSMLTPTSIAKSKRVPPSPFLGKMESRIRCQNCGYNWSMIQPMTMLSAYIPVKQQRVHLMDCIAGFTRSEDVRGVYCQKCKKTNKVEKRLAVVKEPELLCIFINRLKYEKKPGGGLTPVKLDSHVEFEPEFNLGMATSQMSMNHNSLREEEILRTTTDSGSVLSGNYGWLGNGNGHSSSTTSLNTSISAATSPRRSAASGRNTPSEASSVASSSSQFIETKNAKLTRFTDEDDADDHRYGYQLIAVIVHLGNQSGGHYICFRATNPDEPEMEPWLRISDSDIKEVTWTYVSQQHAYMLFYRKKFPSMDYNSVWSDENQLTQSSAAAAFFHAPLAQQQQQQQQQQQTVSSSPAASFSSSSASPSSTSATTSTAKSTRATSTPLVYNSTRITEMPVLRPSLHEEEDEEEASSASSSSAPQSGFLTPIHGASSSDEERSLPNGVVHEFNGLSFSSSSSSLPTSSPGPESADEALKSSNPMLEASELSEEVDHDSRSGLRSALGVPSELLQRPLVEFSHETLSGFDSILAEATPIFKES